MDEPTPVPYRGGQYAYGAGAFLAPMGQRPITVRSTEGAGHALL
ncbi:hypothetical protein [Ruficoccus amylovorans]|nr:hypothetical protein [Ruficoccus amylovorans]